MSEAETAVDVYSIVKNIFQFPFCITFTSSFFLFCSINFIFFCIRKPSTPQKISAQGEATSRISNQQQLSDEFSSNGNNDNNQQIRDAKLFSSFDRGVTVAALLHAIVASLSSIILVILALLVPSQYVPSCLELGSIKRYTFWNFKS